MALSNLFKFGRTFILDGTGDFSDGYTNGFIESQNGDQPITIEAIHRLIVDNLSDLRETPTWNTGYIVGSFLGLYHGSRSQEDEPAGPSIQLGPITLHLNRWRFREGYITGCRHYEACQEEQAAPNIVTARELLETIAHRDSVTQTYSLGHEDLAALEDILGQLVGYLCTALFSQDTQEPTANSLPVTHLQEA